MTPKKSIEVQCRYCKSGQRFDCESTSCRLNDRGLTSLKRIRAHCLDCVGSSPQVAGCRGEVLNPAPHKCSLWDYRLGTNPALKGKGGNIANLRLFARKAETPELNFLP